MTTKGLKKIFISDIHLGDARSLAGPNPYGRCRDNIKNLASFLAEQLTSTTLGEMVILGDLFDTWVIPTYQSPLDSFQAICNNTQNQSVITALREFAQRGVLTYVPGNHDMSMSAQDQEDIRKFLDSEFKGIRYIADPSGVYRHGPIVAEHGHHYALFNAPNTLPAIPSYLPIGYFMSRLEANRSSKGRKVNFLSVLKDFVLEHIFDKAESVHDLFVALAEDADLKKTDLIDMSNLKEFQGIDTTVEAIGKLYEPLLEKWQGPANITWRQAVAGDIGLLLLAAIKVYFADEGAGQDIVIFGHTHGAEMWVSYDIPHLDHLVQEFLVKDFDRVLAELKNKLPIPDAEIWECLKAHPLWPNIKLPLGIKLPCRSLYVNCGTWVDDKKPSTYVETREDFHKGHHYVRLLAYPGNTLRHEGYVKIKP